MTEILRLENIKKSFKDNQVIKSLTLNVAKGGHYRHNRPKRRREKHDIEMH